MASKLLIKRGDGAPVSGSIDEYELVYDYTNNQLYTKVGSTITAISGAVSAVANGSNNRIATFSSSTALNGESTLTWNGSDYLNIQSADGAEGGVRLKKSSTDATHTQYSISHRDDNQTLIIYSYDGTTFRNWITLDEPNALLKLGSNSSALSSFNSDGDLDMHGDIEISATNKLYLDGGSNTYITESSADRVKIFVGGDEMLNLIEGSTNVVRVEDETYLGVGNSTDLFMYHSSGNSFINNGTGNLTIRNQTDDGDIILQSDDGSGGVTAYLTLDGSIAKTTLNKDLRAVDNVKITAGNADDLQIFHDGTDTKIKNNTGDFYISNDANDKDLILRSDDGSGGQTAYITLDGSATNVITHQQFCFEDTNAVINRVSNDLEIRTYGGNDINLMAAGNVGIGTQSPSTNTLQFGSAGDTIGVDLSSGGTTRIAEIELYNSSDGSLRLKTDNASTGGIEFHTEGTKRMEVERGGAVNVSGDLKIPATSKLYLDGGGNSYIHEESADNVMFYIGGRNMLRLHEGNNEVVINDSQLNTDFRVEGDNRDKMLFVDASADIVAINGSGVGGRFNITESTASGNPIAMRIRGYDHAYILSTQNSSATGNPEQFRIEHYDGNVRINSLRGTLALQDTGGGNIGVGTTVPGALFTVKKDGTQASSVSTTYQIQTVSDSNGGIAIQAGSSSTAYLVFGDNGDYDAGRIGYKNASHDLCFFTNNAEEMVLDSDGDLHVDRDVVAFSTTPSDKRLKTNIEDINYGLETIMKLSPKQYDWKKDDTHDIGFIAQEVEEVIPEIVKDKKHFDKEIKTLDYEKLTAVLIKAVQEQQERINKLEEKLNV